MIDRILSEGSNFSLRVGLVTLLLAYLIYAYIQKRREYEVYWPLARAYEGAI